MAITSAVCNSFKTEVLQALHNFTASSGNSFKLALYTSSATLNKSTTAYSTSNEITNSSGSAYTAGGKALTSVTPALSTDTACCDFADISFTSASFTANALAVNEAEVKLISAKSQHAVSVDKAGVTLVSAFPPAV